MVDANGYLDGEVIRYNEKGKEQARAILKAGSLEKGKLYISDNYYNVEANYFIVNKEDNKSSVEVKDNEGKTIFKAEETLEDKNHEFKYLNRLDLPINYLSPNILY